MTDVLADARCPQCASLVRPGQEWCTLCHADLRPAPEPLAEPQPERASGRPDPLSAPLSQLDEAPAAQAPAVAGRHARRAEQPATVPDDGQGEDEPVSEAAIEAMLAQLALESGNPLGEVSGRLGSRSAKAGLAIGLCVGLTVVLLVGSVVLVSIFG